ncbi:hypothetical protein SAMN04488544_1909 [Microlunatus sagamiharensis]|uniref:Uncharacterized protein n=1 Tax=Microlunatus sagamiharensis TaxID=546874 RepID=A0A1H2MED3_9ACTN|nr:hypothetical protein [Microlunatus sagamiharensis]SDU91549.1 hypothetical protein SAMN04488544_1909 [Microlunatus sagamiharensis]
MSTAVDLVNAALLGTDRRPVPAPDGDDPAAWLLAGAGRRRALTLVAAGTASVAPPAPGPALDRPLPSEAARAVLDELLASGSEPLVDLWLREALDAGTGLAPEHWTRVLDSARRASRLDRRRVGAALGPGGLWFARHNPAWSALVRAAEAAVADPGSEPADDRLTPDAARREIAALATGALGPAAARAQGQGVGTRLPLDAYDAVADAGLAAEVPSARAGLSAAEEVLWVRWDLAHAFDPDRVPPERRAVPLAPDHVQTRPHALQERR